MGAAGWMKFGLIQVHYQKIDIKYQKCLSAFAHLG